MVEFAVNSKHNHHLQVEGIFDKFCLLKWALSISLLGGFALQSWLMIASPLTADGVGALIVHLFTNRF